MFLEFSVTKSKSYELWRDSFSLIKSATTTATEVLTPTDALLRFLSSVDAVDTTLTSAKFINPTTWPKLLTGYFHVSSSILIPNQY